MVRWTSEDTSDGGGALICGEAELVADVSAVHPEDDIFRDVGGVVADALQIAGNDDGIERLLSPFRVLLNGG